MGLQKISFQGFIKQFVAIPLGESLGTLNYNIHAILKRNLLFCSVAPA
jgi:hypothetical protein